MMNKIAAWVFAFFLVSGCGGLMNGVEPPYWFVHPPTGDFNTVYATAYAYANDSESAVEEATNRVLTSIYILAKSISPKLITETDTRGNTTTISKHIVKNSLNEDLVLEELTIITNRKGKPVREYYQMNIFPEIVEKIRHEVLIKEIYVTKSGRKYHAYILAEYQHGFSHPSEIQHNPELFQKIFEEEMKKFHDKNN